MLGNPCFQGSVELLTESSHPAEPLRKPTGEVIVSEESGAIVVDLEEEGKECIFPLILAQVFLVFLERAKRRENAKALSTVRSRHLFSSPSLRSLFSGGI